MLVRALVDKHYVALILNNQMILETMFLLLLLLSLLKAFATIVYIDTEFQNVCIITTDCTHYVALFFGPLARLSFKYIARTTEKKKFVTTPSTRTSLFISRVAIGYWITFENGVFTLSG